MNDAVHDAFFRDLFNLSPITFFQKLTNEQFYCNLFNYTLQFNRKETIFFFIQNLVYPILYNTCKSLSHKEYLYTVHKIV